MELVLHRVFWARGQGAVLYVCIWPEIRRSLHTVKERSFVLSHFQPRVSAPRPPCVLGFVVRYFIRQTRMDQSSRAREEATYVRVRVAFAFTLLKSSVMWPLDYGPMRAVWMSHPFSTLASRTSPLSTRWVGGISSNSCTCETSSPATLPLLLIIIRQWGLCPKTH